MKTLAAVCIKRPVFASMLVLCLVVVGAATYTTLGVDRFPAVDLPQVFTRTMLPGASPEEVEVLVSQPLEEAINRVEGLDEIRSVSGPGSSIVIATFKLERNINTATQDVRDRVAGVLPELPRDVIPPIVAKSDNDSAPVITIALSADRPLRELTEMADKIVRPLLERSGGVGDVEIVGGLERAINVWADSARLAAYQLPITAIRDTLARQNADLPGGNVTSDTKEQTLRTMGRVVDARDFDDLVIATRNGAPIRVRDIGFAEDGTKEQRSIARLNGVPTVTIAIRRQSGANTVAVIEGVKANMERIRPQLPADVQMEVIRDQSRYIYAALGEINLHLILGSILACLVVFTFMRDWRATVIAGVAIPASVIATFGMMAALGFTLNSVTMLALVLMVGIVIDDAIVVLENIFRFVEEKGMGSFEAARAATAEIALPVLATTLSLVVIFVPVSFMSSIAGRFLYQFGITAAVAILVSLLVSFTLTPMMSARLFRKRSHEEHGASRKGFYAAIDRRYAAMLGWSMRHRLALSIATLVIIASMVPVYGRVLQEFVPSGVDEGEFEVGVSAPEGTSLAAMNEAMMSVEQQVRDIPSVRVVLASAGGSFLGAVNQGEMYVRLADHHDRVFSWMRLIKGLVTLDPGAAFRDNASQAEVMRTVRARLRQFKDLRFSVRNVQSINLGSGRTELDLAIRGPELEALADYSERLRAMAPQLGIVDADTTLRLNKPELQVRIDRARAADLQVETQDIATALRVMVGGDAQVTRFRDSTVNDDYDVQLRLVDKDRNDPRTLGHLLVPGKNGELIRLDNLVNIVEAESPSRVDRTDRQRQANLRAGVAQGYAQADRMEALRQAALGLGMPPAYSVAVAGRAKELERTFKEFLWAFMLSIIFMYMILAAQFESVVHPFTILLSLPVAVPFALLSLWMTSQTLNLYSALGLLVLFGVVKKNAILQVDRMNNLRAEGMERGAAIMQANRDRLRPILMTTLALVGAMLPLALGTGPGAEERRSIAVVVIGGQTLSLLLTLLVTPVAYSVFDDLWGRVHARKGKEAAVVNEAMGH